MTICSCILITKDCQFSHKLTSFLPNVTGASIVGLLFSCLPWFVAVWHFLLSFTFTVHMLHIFRICVGHFPNFLRVSFMFKYFSSFYILSAPKISSRSRHYFTFYFSKKSLIFHAIYLFNNIKYFFEFVTTLYHGKFWKEEEKGKDQSRYILRSYVKSNWLRPRFSITRENRHHFINS